MAPAKSPEIARGDTFRAPTGVGFNTPAKIGALPRAEAIAPGKTPHRTKHYLDSLDLGGAAEGLGSDFGGAPGDAEVLA